MRSGGLNRANILILSLSIVAVTPLAAQTVNGRVVDALTGTALAGTAVRLSTLGTFVLTNREGFFTLSKLPPGVHELSVEHLGYQNQIVKIELPSNSLVEVKLEPQPIVMERLTIVHDRFEERRKSAGTFSQVFARNDIVATEETNPLEFLMLKGGVKPFPCPARYQADNAVCVRRSANINERMRRGTAANPARYAVPVIVYVDDQLVGPRCGAVGSDIFQSHALQDFYRIETYEFNGRIIRAYTMAYMQRLTGDRNFLESVKSQHADALADYDCARRVR